MILSADGPRQARDVLPHDRVPINVDGATVMLEVDAVSIVGPSTVIIYFAESMFDSHWIVKPDYPVDIARP